MIINKEAINQAIADFDSIENAIEAAGVDVPYGTDTSEYGNKIAEACQASYQQGYNNGLSEGESGIITIIDPAIESHGVDVPEGMDKSGYADKIDEVYQVGYDTGLVDGGINWSQCTDWRYFSYYDNRNDLVAKLKYSDTANGTDFSYMFAYCSKLTTIPQLDTSNGANFSYMFRGCSALTSVPQFDTSNGTNFSSMFNDCSALTSVPQFDTSNGTNFQDMFVDCRALTSIPPLDTSSGTNFNEIFRGCSGLTAIPQIDTSKGQSMVRFVYMCSALKNIPEIDTSTCTSFNGAFQGCNNLITIPKLDCTSVGNSNNYVWNNVFGGCSKLENVTFAGTIKINSNVDFFSTCPNLTVDSLMSFINALTNMSSSSTYKITIGSTNLAKLTQEQKDIATNKRITLA